MSSTLSYAATALLFLAELTSCASSSSSSSRWSTTFAFFPHTTTHRSITQLKQHGQRFGTHPLYSTSPIVDEIPSDATLDEDPATTSSSDPESILQSRNKLIALSQTLSANSSSGKIFVTRPADKIKLQNAINSLEALTESSSAGTSEQSSSKKDMLLGDWTLIVTANLPSSDIRRRFDNNEKKKGGVWGKKKQKSHNEKQLNPIQKSIQQTIEVTQRIRNDYNRGEDETSNIINRVDNVIEFTPLNTLEDILPSSLPIYDIVSKININPLQISKGKVVLIHKAEIESTKPILRTKISWTSSVLNVAGESQYFDTDGDDVFGINNLLGEFINVGTFDTPYVDEDVRISRSSGPVFETLRVFVKKGSSLLDEDSMLLENLSAELRVEEDMEVEQSGDDVVTQVKKVVEAADNVQKSISSMTSNAKSTIEKDIESVNKVLGETMDDVVGKVQDVVEDDIEQIGKAVEDVQSAIQGEGYELVDAIQNVTKAVAKVPSDVKDIVDKDAEDLRTKTIDALDSMVADVQDSVESDLKNVEKTMEDMRDAVTGSSSDVGDDGTDEEEEETNDAKKDE